MSNDQQDPMQEPLTKAEQDEYARLGLMMARGKMVMMKERFAITNQNNERWYIR